MSDDDTQTNASENTSEQPAATEPKAEETSPTVGDAYTGEAPGENKTIETLSTDNDGQPLIDTTKIDLLSDVYITLTIEVGRAQIKIRDLLNLNKGSIIELDKLAGEPVDIYANGKLISSGSIITANGKYCVRLSGVNEKNKPGVEPHGK